MNRWVTRGRRSCLQQFTVNSGHTSADSRTAGQSPCVRRPTAGGAINEERIVVGGGVKEAGIVVRGGARDADCGRIRWDTLVGLCGG